MVFLRLEKGKGHKLHKGPKKPETPKKIIGTPMEWESLFDVGCITGKVIEITEKSPEDAAPVPEHTHRNDHCPGVPPPESEGGVPPFDGVEKKARKAKKRPAF
jgi:hypothetical protein